MTQERKICQFVTHSNMIEDNMQAILDNINIIKQEEICQRHIDKLKFLNTYLEFALEYAKKINN